MDLDGTLIATDVLWESVLLLVRKAPTALLAAPFWALEGRATFKRRLAEHVQPNPAALPYRAEVVQLVEAARRDGRKVLLVTASDQAVADAVAEHLGLFDEALGSDGQRNLKGTKKGQYLAERFGKGGFDYAGDSSADLGVWSQAHRGHAVAASPSTVRRARAEGNVEPLPLVTPGSLRAAIRALRPHQWAKNVLLFVPAILAHRYRDPGVLFHLVLAFFSFSLCASSVYVLNDLLDLESDRQHRSKKRRPLASGALSIPSGIALGIGALAAGLGVAVVWLPLGFQLALLGYLALTTAYSVFLKRKLLLDVIMLALLFTYRVLAGGIAVNVDVSFWLLAFSLFFFTGLAFVKRYSELVALQEKELAWVPGRNYTVIDLDLVRSIGPASGIASVLVMCLYLNSPEVRELYAQPEVLILIAPVLLYWISRIWFLAGRNELDDDPVVFAIRDRVSLLTGAIVALLVLIARFPWPGR